MGDRQKDRQTDMIDRQLCIALRPPHGRQADGQTDHSASLCGHHLGDRWRDRPLCVGAAGRTDSRSLSSVLPAAHRLPTGSILWKMLPRGAEVGSHPLAWEPACVGPPGTASVGVLTGWLCWHLLAPPLTHSASTGLTPCSAPVQLMRESKCGGIYFNRWRTIFFPSFIRHTAPYQFAEPRAVMWSHQGSAGTVTASSHLPSRTAFPCCTSQLWDKTRWFSGCWMCCLRQVYLPYNVTHCFHCM